MTRTTITVLAAAAICALAGCGIGNDSPVVVNPEITVIAVTDTTITISWRPAANEPGLDTGFRYRVYTSASTMISSDDLDGATLQVTVPADELLAVTISGLTSGTGYHINVAVVNQRSGDLELYNDVVGITSGVQVVTDTYTAAVPYFNHSTGSTGASTAVEYTIDLGASPVDVYLVFSNPAAADLVRPEVVLGSFSDAEFPTWPAASVAPPTAPAARSVTPTGPIILRDRPDIADWEPPEPVAASRSITPPPPPPSWAGMDPDLDVVDLEGEFYDDSTSNLIPATCRAVVGNGDGTTLSIWVETSEWDDSPPIANYAISSEMVDFLADAFLKAGGTDNDIFDWVTNVYGEEWGSDTPSYLIPDQNHITILLWNIGDDGAGGVVGYFWAKDNYTAGAVSYSNERVMFSLDSQSFGEPFGVGDTWHEENYWPQEMVATLAHEFQHMIHYYQRDVVLGASTETWLNEMMSLVSEDLVARKLYAEYRDFPDYNIDLAGPRGVVPSWATESGGAGDPNNDYGRLPLYNANPSINLSTWLSSNDVLKSYSIAYAFGAFLSRNFGGADLFGAMMDSASSNSGTVISSATGVTMDDLLWQWGVSVLLSDDASVQSEVEMNTGAWIEPATTLTGYDLGSINHFNYDQYGSSADGPVIHTDSSYPLTEMEGMSTIFYELGLGQTGALTAVFLVPNGVDFTVVVK